MPELSVYMYTATLIVLLLICQQGKMYKLVDCYKYSVDWNRYYMDMDIVYTNKF